MEPGYCISARIEHMQTPEYADISLHGTLLELRRRQILRPISTNENQDLPKYISGYCTLRKLTKAPAYDPP